MHSCSKGNLQFWSLLPGADVTLRRFAKIFIKISQKASAIRRRDEKNCYTTPINVSWSQLNIHAPSSRATPTNLTELLFFCCFCMHISLQVIAILALYECWGYKTRDIFTQVGVTSHHLVSLPSYLAYNHGPPNRNDYNLGPSTLSTSFQLWVGLKAECHHTPKLLYCSAYCLAWTASPLNLVLKPSQTLHYLFWNRNCYSNTAVRPVIKLCRPLMVHDQCLQCVVC